LASARCEERVLVLEEELPAQRHGRTFREPFGESQGDLDSLCETSTVKSARLLRVLSGQQLPLGERTDMAQAGEELRQRVFVLALRPASGAGGAHLTESAVQLSPVRDASANARVMCNGDDQLCEPHLVSRAPGTAVLDRAR
jgi:hypothetical protein